MRGLLAGVVLLAALGGVVWWSETHDKKSDSAGKDSKDNPKLVTFKDEDVTKLEIRRANADPVVLSKDKDGWTMQSPKPVRVDSDAVNGVVSAVSALTWDHLVEDKPSDLGQFGLAQPSLQVTVTTKDNKSASLQVGDETPVQGAFYAKLAGDPRVFSIGTGIKSNVDKTWRDLRDKRMLTVDDQKLSRVDLANAHTAGLEFGRTGSNEWQILKPRPLRADGWAVDELVRKVRETRLPATGTDEDEKKNAADFAFATRVALVTLTDPSGSQTFDVRRKGESFFAKSSAVDAVAKVEKDLVDTVSKSPNDFRAKKLFDFGFAEPSKMDIRDNAKSYSISKGGDGKWWQNGKEMDPTSVQSLIDKLRELQAASLADSGFTTPVLEITVVSDNGKRTEKVQLSKGAQNWAARRENDNTVYILDNKKVEDIQSAAGDVKAPAPPPPAPAGKK